VIKRRVRQKLEIMSEEQTASAAPTDAELSAYMTQNTARFIRPAMLSFEQIFFDGAASVSEVKRAVAAAKAALARGADPTRLGQSTLLPRSADQLSVELLARDFGAGFAKHLAAVPIGEWTGPVASSLGAHLVKVSARANTTLPPLDEVRQQVTHEGESERRERSRTDNYRTLRERYEVVIEPNLPPAGASP